MDERIAALVSGYGDGSDGSVPTPAQWRGMLAEPGAGAPTLINFFKLRDHARYPATSVHGSEARSGHEAFGRYSAVSAPALEKVGGRFLVVAPFRNALIGDDEDWDLVAIGSYPDRDALIAIFEDAEYRDAFVHRRAACERQRVFVVG